MPRVIRTPQANVDLLEIWDYIARDNMPAADMLVRRIDEMFTSLSRNPLLGALHEEYRPGHAVSHHRRRKSGEFIHPGKRVESSRAARDVRDNRIA